MQQEPRGDQQPQYQQPYQQPYPYQQQPVVMLAQQGPPMVVRVFWYLFVGWWLAGIVCTVAYLLILTVIGIPVALMIFNRIPTVLTLRTGTTAVSQQMVGGVMMARVGAQAQRAMWLRIVYFLLVGWWFSGLWLALAYLLQLTIIGIPLGLMMLNRIGGILTLYRY